MSEIQLQHEIISALRKLGFIVLSTSSAAAGRPKRFKDHSSRGIPDLLVSRKEWGHWLGLEVKLPKGRIKPEQKELSDMGLVHIVYSLDDALSVVGCDVRPA